MLHVHEWGPADAPPVVCLHGVTGHGRRFRKLAEGTHEAAIEARLAKGELLPHARPLLVEDYLDHLVSADDGLLRPRYAQSAVVTAFSEMAAPPPDFALLGVPTLIVRGELSNVTVDPLIELYQAGVGGLLEVVDVPGYHSPFWDAFDETAAAIDRFL